MNEQQICSYVERWNEYYIEQIRTQVAQSLPDRLVSLRLTEIAIQMLDDLMATDDEDYCDEGEK